jgi:hypothetical protein
MTAAQLAEQAAWIAADVATIDRSVTPWVVAFSHKAWQMDSTTWTLYDWMPKAGVDFHFVGHWHQYTRYPPIDSSTGSGKVVIDSASMNADYSVYTNPKYPTLVVTGAPGDIEVNPDHCSEQWQITSKCSGNCKYRARFCAPLQKDSFASPSPARLISIPRFSAIPARRRLRLLPGCQCDSRTLVLEYHGGCQGLERPHLQRRVLDRQERVNGRGRSGRTELLQAWEIAHNPSDLLRVGRAVNVDVDATARCVAVTSASAATAAYKARLSGRRPLN